MSKLLNPLIVLTSAVVFMAVENPWVGTWKMEPTKTALSANPKAVTARFLLRALPLQSSLQIMMVPFSLLSDALVFSSPSLLQEGEL
jgi:hypothetical protein